KRATDAFKAGEKALEGERHGDAEAEFKKAIDAFGRARDAAAKAALERDTKEARTKVEQLRATRADAATGFFTRRKLAKADSVLARGTAAAASGDFADAKSAFAEAAALFAAMPAAATPPPPPAPAKAPGPAKAAPAPPAAAPAAKRAAKSPVSAEATSLSSADATKITSADAPSLLDAPTKITGSGTLDDGATVVAERPSATKVDRASLTPPAPVGAEPARGLPVVWIGAAAAGVMLIAGVWMLRSGTTPSTLTPPPSTKIAAKTDVAPPAKADVVPPIEPKAAATARAPEPPAATAVQQQVAKVEEPPPAPPAPTIPKIASLAPEAERVEPASDSQQFRIALADPNGATYAWSVDGKIVSDATAATFTAKADTKPRAISVLARTAGGEVTHKWELAALAPPPEPKVPATAPVISGFEPKDKTLQLTPGKSRRFSVKAKYDGAEPVRYAWSVDGKSVGGNAPTFDLAADDDDEGATRQVRAEVSAAGGPVAKNEWTVTVPAAPVTITRPVPAPAEIVADLGTSTDFSVEARAGRASASALSYTWTVNKRPAADANGPRFTYRPDRAGSADVEVRVEAPDRPAATRRWTVKAREQAPVAQPTQIAALPPRVEPTPVARIGGDAKRELENWVASYRDAYQQKNVDRLVTLGVVKPENRGKLAGALADLDDLKVTIASSAIDVQSPETAVVTLTREDSFNAGGRRQTQSINIKKNLRKVNGSWIAQ
ncbi:MAG: PKD domain-containing protein, partial [Candidatus Binatia bacterium]